MLKNIFWTVIIILILIGLYSFFGWGDNTNISQVKEEGSTSRNYENTQTEIPVSTTTQSVKKVNSVKIPAPIATANVTIENASFNPSIIYVKQGTKVTWINNDNAIYKIVQGTTINSPELKKGDSFSYTFYLTGTNYYHNGYNSAMMGRVIVQ